MFFRILKKDLKRKKVMNAILLCFILLATMFVASGISNVVSVMNGTDSYLDKAEIGDYVVISMGADSKASIDEILHEMESIRDYRIEPVVFGEKSNLKDMHGEELEAKNSVIYQSIEDSRLKFFDKENKQITQIKPGHAYATGDFMEKNHLQPGDKIRITHNSISFMVTLDGMAKDALLGSSMMGNSRFLFHREEIEKLLSDETIYNGYQGQISYIDLKDEAGVSEIASAISQAPGIMFSGARSLIKMCYVMDMIVAFTMLILSICLIIVSFVVLKFSITFTIFEEFREIGVMKAIGISNFKIRSLYLTKYLMLAVIGAFVGFFMSIPFSDLLLRSVSSNMVLEADNHFLLSVLGAILVVIVILLYAFRCTKLVKKSSPIDAIRSGQTGERYKKKSPFRLVKSHGSTGFFMAVNDVFSAPKRYMTIITTFFLCTLFVLVFVNVSSTMRSDTFITTFGTRSDLYYTDLTEAMSCMNPDGRKQIEEYFAKTEALFKKNGMPAKLCVETQYKYKVHFDGKDYSISCQQGIHTKASAYEYINGVVPQNKNEIAITPTVSKLTGAKLGDTVTIDFGKETLDCVVVAYFQSMNQLGEVIRLHEDAPTDFTYIANVMSYQIDFDDHPSAKEIEIRKEKIKKLFDNEKVMNATEYCDDCMGVASTMESVQYLLLGITLIVVILVCILMERSFLADEKSQIAVLKAMGFGNRRVMEWHMIRFGIVTLVAVLLAAICSIPAMYLIGNPIFGMMGAGKVAYVIRPWKIFFLYPGIIFLMTLLASGMTALQIRTIPIAYAESPFMHSNCGGQYRVNGGKSYGSIALCKRSLQNLCN